MKTVERRLRILQPDNNDVHEPNPNTTRNISSFKVTSLSSSKAYLSGSSPLSATIIEETWAEATLTSISLLRTSSASFEHRPFLDPSYGKDVTKLTFEGPCSPKAVSKALETFPAIQSLEFGAGFFIHEDVDIDLEEVLKSKRYPRIESLTVNCDMQNYIKLNQETEKPLMERRIISLLIITMEGFPHLSHCSFTLPNISQVDNLLTCINAAITHAGSTKGKKWTEKAATHVNLN